LKNSEDVQDALIEDYFRYNDLSRMEADDILMNISEIESPYYETSSGFRSSCYWMDWKGANTENVRIGLVFVVLAH
jgi:hypothetical protein